MISASRITQRASSPYGYEASFPLAVVGAILFCVIGAVYFYQFFRYRAWVFFPMLLAILMVMTGFISRAYSIQNPTVLSAYLTSYITIILAPSFMAAACYMVFGRLIWWVTPERWRGFRSLWVPARWVTPVFVSLDLTSFLVQLAGLGGVASVYYSNLSPEETQKKLDASMATLKLGLVVQLLGFGIFTVIGARFVILSSRWKDDWPAKDAGNWQRLGWAINASCALIMLRAVYRVIEFSGTQGQGSYFETYEWPFWVFDALFVLTAFVVFIFIHPGIYLPAAFTGFRLDKKKLNSPNQTTMALLRSIHTSYEHVPQAPADGSATIELQDRGREGR